MSQRLVSFFSSNPSIGANARTPLSARWAQMSQQEQIIEKKRLEVLEKMEAEKKNTPKQGELSKPPPTVNKFSNDGSFMEQFKKLAQGKKPEAATETKFPVSDKNTNDDGGEQNINKNKEEGKDRDNRDRNRDRGREKDKDYGREKDRDKGRERDRERGRNREQDERRERRRSSSRSDRSRSPRRRDNNRNDRDYNKDNRNKRWDSGNDHYAGSRRKSPSPSDEHRRRKSRFSSPNSFSPNNLPPIGLLPDNVNNPPPFIPMNNESNYNKPPSNNNNPYNNQPFNGPPGKNQSFGNNAPMNNSNQMNPMPLFGNNNFNMRGNGPNTSIMPPNMMSPNRQNTMFGPPSFSNNPPNIPSLLDSPLLPPFNTNRFSQMPPPSNEHIQFNNRNHNMSNSSPNNGPPTNMSMPPHFMPSRPNNMSGPPGNFTSMPPPITCNDTSIPPPGIRIPGPLPNMMYPPGVKIPLHNIPEPKPLDTLSIPPPKPLDAMSIPPPKPLDTMKIPPPAPLDAVKIPPPRPMNLQKIPPPMPICLTQIPKPKELDLCTIPPPMTGNDNRRSGLMMEGIASQMERSGQDMDIMPNIQPAQDPSLWFQRDRNNVQFKPFSESVGMFQDRYANNKDNMKCNPYNENNQRFIPDEDKYEPEFSLQDDSSNEENSREDYTARFESTASKVHNFSNLGRSLDNVDRDFNDDSRESRRRKKRSRWGDAEDSNSSAAAPGISDSNLGVSPMPIPGPLLSIPGPVLPVPGPALPVPGPVLPISGEKPHLTRITRQDPGLVQYAINSFGTANLNDEEWVKCEDHYKISLLYQEMLVKRRELDKLAAKGHHKYEYDSDEETDGGTWEHKSRRQEMEATSEWAMELNKAAHGKHHIGDFLPPEELKKFMIKYSAVKTGKEPDLSDYKEYKLKEDNIGFKMLQKLGWSEGEGLGADGSGIMDPVSKGSSRCMNQGLGIDRSDVIDEGDDEFDAYRKRMMLAYRFRPNPMNNPRRPYY